MRLEQRRNRSDDILNALNRCAEEQEDGAACYVNQGLCPVYAPQINRLATASRVANPIKMTSVSEPGASVSRAGR